MSITVTDARLDGRPCGLRAESGVIVELGPDVEARPGDEVIAANGAVLVPPLVNGHTHAAMTLFRGHGDDLPLMRWLTEKIWPVEAALLPEDVYWGARLACVEMIRSGTVRFWDMYWHPEAAARAVIDAGLRATVAAPLIDARGDGKTLREHAIASIDAIAGGDDTVDVALGPHAIYTVSERSLRWIAELAADLGVCVHMHLAETEHEVIDCVREHGMRPAAYLDRLGLLGPRTLLAHGVWLDDAELELIAARGATIVTNPVANLKLAVGGVFPYPAARRAGVAVGLGTDGAASNNSLDLFSDMKTFALLQKHAATDPEAVGAPETWEVATGQRAPLLGTTGTLAVGEAADFLLLRADAPELAFGEISAGLVYAAGRSIVDTTVVGGRVLMRHGTIAGADEVLARAIECARRLGLGCPASPKRTAGSPAAGRAPAATAIQR